MLELPTLTPVVIAEMNPPLRVTRVVNATTIAQMEDFFARTLAAGGVIGCDIETTPLKDFYYRRIRTIQFGDLKEQYVIDLRAFVFEDYTHVTTVDGINHKEGYKSKGDILFEAQGQYGKNLTPLLKSLVKVIEPVLCSSSYLKVGVNLGFEYLNFYWNLGLRTWHFWDCAMVEKCIYAGASPLKRYATFSMEEMMARYFQLKIDKMYQESFTLDADLIDDQINYAALDTRFPLAIRAVQMLILKGTTYKQLVAAGKPAQKYLRYIDPLVQGDDLREIAQIENDAIGAFEDMNVHGERLDRTRWLTRVQKSKEALLRLLEDELDPVFLPIVGSKLDIITDEQIEAARQAWKIYADPSPEEKAFLRVSPAETEINGLIRKAEKLGNIAAIEELTAEKAKIKTDREAAAAALKAVRDEKKEFLKKEASDLGKRRTKIKNLIKKCEGQALINYGSDKQLLKVLIGMKGFKNLTNLDDDVLAKYPQSKVMCAIREYHRLSKEIGTYGDAWATEFTTKPCKEEGWLNPGDGRLHCVFNQYDAETGRSSSEKPNGQNLPQDKEVRGCFISDPPNENIRISDCCQADTRTHGIAIVTDKTEGRWCEACGLPCSTHAEEYMYITCDMSGAELRIIAEVANDPVWIGAFTRGEDVHSVCTELLYPEKWPELALPDCAYYKLREDGTPQHKKCKCPEHNSLRDGTKAVNFLLCYGGGASTLAARIGVKKDKAQELLDIHAARFPRIWAYLEDSGKKAKVHKKSFDMFGRRRLFPEPTMDRARDYFIKDKADRLELDDDEATDNVVKWNEEHPGEKPDEDTLFWLTHRKPTNKEVISSLMGLGEGIGRQGKNHPIQSANATIAKLAMGWGFDKDGIPFLWHTLPKLRAKLVKFVHDELVIQAPKQLAQKVADEIQSAFKRAAAMRMVKVFMESEFHIATYWQK
jgi:DNA polymerase I-like protein with 3'-5' exonuclease and polymerase domains